MAVCDHPDHQPALRMPDESFFDHLTAAHPEAVARLERWPDGALVVLDETLDPADFEAGR